ncbi:MAG: damage-control phosphatase ARMT1 family protein [Candidatus Geothermincolia bacterium]
MKILPDCHVCAMRQALAAARLVSDDPDFQHRCLQEAARLLAECPLDVTPPEAGEGLYRMVREMSGNPDPFEAQKREQNDAVLEIVPWLRETVASADDPLLMAVRLAIAGNVVDPGAQASFDLEKSVVEAVSGERGLEHFDPFARRLGKARSVLVVADNCGEVVFDMVLIEAMRQARGGELDITVAVRSAPIINDVTEKEARAIGLDRLARVMPSGSEMPGTVLARSTAEFQEIFEGADLVISKGQGNWETLEDSEREVFFMFQAKCPAVALMNDCPEGSLLLLKNA